jgi:carbonic anhydrase/acetyltransferase-like protein (isoleucine patch superfamily)
MHLEHLEKKPSVHESAYVAPTAVLCGDVRVGEGSCILFGAVLSAEGGAVEIGSHCVVMEHGVIRGTRRQPARLGDRVLVGPRSHLSGCSVEDDAFLATGVTVFNGARIGAGAEVRINGVVHVNSTVPAGGLVPIGWIAVGDPAEILPPERHDQIWPIQKSMDFRGTVWGVDRSVSYPEIMHRYCAALRRHAGDRVLPPD